MSSFRLVDYEERYAADCTELYNYYITNSTATFHLEPYTVQQMREVFASHGPRYDALVVLDEAERFLGYAYTGPFKPRPAYDVTAEMTVYLISGVQRQGIGRAAVAELERRAKPKGIHSILAVICGENTASIALFEACGYVQRACLKEVGNKFGRYLDSVILQKMIGGEA